MAGFPHFEAPSALDYFAALVAEDEGFPLLEAAVALAQDEHPQLDVQAVLSEVDVLTQRLRQRVPADAAPLQRLRLLNQFFFQELGFAGNVNHYFDRANSDMAEVLRSRRGIPISLAVLYLELASHAGLDAHGVSFPGHFMVKLRLPMGAVMIDPFTGKSLSREELEERLTPFRQVQHRQMHSRGSQPEDDEVPLALYLVPSDAREIIARMLRNLKEIHRAALDWQRLAAVQRRLCLLLPQAWEEHRDLALALAELGQLGPAVAALEAYLLHRPQATDARVLRQHLQAWQAAS
jgi:regulator of sirC expression with transglutaminase-like and TPR domain